MERQKGQEGTSGYACHHPSGSFLIRDGNNSKSRYQIRQSLTIDDNSGQPESGIEKSDTFTPEKKTEPVLRVREPLDKNTKFPEVPAPFQKLNYPEIDYMREASPSSGEEKEEIPERYEITGYVQRSNPHRATGVTFDDMDMIEKAMASDELTEAEQEQARQTSKSWKARTWKGYCRRASWEAAIN